MGRLDMNGRLTRFVNISINVSNVNAVESFFFSIELCTFLRPIRPSILFLTTSKGSPTMTEQLDAPKGQGFGSILMNVFSSPGEAFQGLRETESRPSLWLIPLVLLILLSSASTFVLFSNDSLKTQILESRDRALQKQVESGRMTQGQADQQRTQMESMGGMFVAIGIVSNVILLTLATFGAGLFLWLSGKLALKSTAGYGKHLEVYGISNWIGLLGGIVTVLMIVGMNSIYVSPGAGLAVYATFDPVSTTHRILSALNIFSIWQAVIVGIGLSKLADKPSSVGIGVAVVLWVLWVVVQILLQGLCS